MNITLIGMPGAGKSYIGEKLANKLGYALVELDKILEKEYGLPLQQAVEKMGEKHFLKTQEEDAINHTLGRDNLVISPGGSIVYTDRAMQHLKNISTIVYLKTPLQTIEKRIAIASRGIIGLKNKTLDELYAERTTLYERWASNTIEANREAEMVVEDILKTLAKI